MNYLSQEEKDLLEEYYNEIPKEWFEENKTEVLNPNTILSVNDNSKEEYQGDILNHLLVQYHTFSTHAMSDHQLYLQGQKNMLGGIILILKNS